MTKGHQQRNFRQLLQDTLAERQNKNPKYSLRAFARSLEVAPSILSDILKENRPITEGMKNRLGIKLSLTPQQINVFPHDASRTKGTVFNATRPVEKMSLDTFAIFADWFHFAILELTKISGFKSSVEYISHALKIDKSKAKNAIDRLLSTGLLAVDDAGEWYDASDEQGILSNINSQSTSIASKNNQKQILQLSIDSLDTQNIEVRNHTNMTMAIDVKDLPKAIERIKEFRRGLCCELEKATKPTDVYHLHIGFYSVTQKENDK